MQINKRLGTDTTTHKKKDTGQTANDKNNQEGGWEPRINTTHMNNYKEENTQYDEEGEE